MRARWPTCTPAGSQDWRFLATSEPMHSTDFAQRFRGLHLPRAVIDKIYRRNAESMFAGGWM